jgi:hypothetical protein
MMEAIAGIFTTTADAKRAAEGLRSIGIPNERINLLAPGASENEFARVPTTETEQPGMGKAIGGVVGGALGVTGGLHFATTVSLFVPGVGPVLAAGLIAGALLGTGGAIGGAAIGGAIENSIADGLPKDEMFVYEDAIRKGRTVVFVLVDDEAQAEAARNVLTQAGAENIDAAREAWWIGLRDVEEEGYQLEGGDFKTDEPVFRRGFEAALLPESRGKSYPEAANYLRARYADIYSQEAFRRGYARGQAHYQSLQEKHKVQDSAKRSGGMA